MEESHKESFRAMERHIQSVLVAVCVALLGWLAYNTSQQGEQIASLTATIRGLEGQISILNAQTTDRYPASRAAIDLTVRDREIDDLKSRLRELERTVYNNEGGQR